MKNLGKVTFIAMFTLLFSISFSSVQAQENAKVEKATSKFCNSITSFLDALVVLDEQLVAGDDKAIDKAYNAAVKGWNTMVKDADKLENVEVKESVKSYNQLVDNVNKLSKDGITDDEAKQISANVQSTSDEINAILNSTCK
jgi:ABC-type transport system involved in cytochrome bd biosynthesis fused ATPase/permease subunit